ncbi:ribosome silencing factor [Janthinobacterium fluminis]|uniref:Ribosomal silencing factor RsfS n=1 Tax=Janthinobacterium fluminis TaxID=2987524 RepID=A0ABT5K1P1_9BURK|nr:ribosome silencing factor [Janthinobacterium fluminis]MDC8758902.1 ribosome silencing factor [Janthinobacterium fluminis]
MDIKKLQTLVVDALEDVKGQDIAVFETAHLTSLFDRIAIVSGTSNRQTKALAASVRDKVKEAGGDIIGVEGEDTGEWVLVDLGDMIVHIMQAPIRAYYRLEEIWGEKPVKLGAAKRLASKRTASEGEEAPKKTGSHLAASKAKVETAPVIEKKPAKKAAAGTTAAKAKAPAAKKAPASKAVGKTVKVAPTKTEAAAVKALKALPPKAPAPKAAKAPKVAADAAPAKTVIKRIKKVAE